MSDYARIFLTPNISVQSKDNRNKPASVIYTITNGKFNTDINESFVIIFPGNGVYRKTSMQNSKHHKMKEHKRMRLKAQVIANGDKLRIDCKPIGERGAVFYAALSMSNANTDFSIAGNKVLAERKPIVRQVIP